MRVLKLAVLFVLMMSPGLPVRTVRAQDAISDLFGRINTLRSSVGLPPYTYNNMLAQAAQNQAQWMASTGEVSHVQTDGSRPRDRARAAGYDSPWISENIYAGTMASPDTAWDFWIHSPVHYASITNTTYTQIGIATAEGTLRSYVLVFGAPPGTAPYRPPVTGSGSSGSAGNNGGAASAPPSFVVGVDSSGNIMHEVQPDDTLGDIALLYGYTWDVIPTVLAINGMTEADVRVLKQGSVILIPPHAGTYTPTAATDTPTWTPSPTVITPTPSPTAASIAAVISPTAAPGEMPALPPPATYIAATLTPVQTAMLVRTVPAASTDAPALIAPVADTISAAPVPADNRTPLLVVAVIVQVAILGFASVEFVRRSRK